MNRRDANSASACCSGADTDQAYYELIIKRASVLLSSVQVNMLKFALSLRAYSATVHSFQQVPQSQPDGVQLCLFCVSDFYALCSQIASNEAPPPGCSAFFSVHGAKTCYDEALAALLETAAKRSRPGHDTTQFQGTT